MSRAPGGSLLLLGGLGLLAAFVFAVLPRWASAPVVTTEATPASSPSAWPSEEPSVTTPPPREAAEPELERPRAAPAAAPDDWSAAVSAGFAALESGDFKSAGNAFDRAEALRPGAPAVADGLARARSGLLEQSLRAHRQRAEAAEAREDWSAALAEHDAALKLDAAVSFAVLGRSRCAARAALDERLRRYLERPDRLAAEAVAREAATLLEPANETKPAGPRLLAQRASVESLLAGVRRPVAVRLLSDGLTR
ncbi:MAG TPA: hypothetical protein VFM88_09705, partial [Vicinamibacteria bacterium]|nr:hypothetical protein [Vicinamibacteria bacterium]